MKSNALPTRLRSLDSRDLVAVCGGAREEVSWGMKEQANADRARYNGSMNPAAQRFGF